MREVILGWHLRRLIGRSTILVVATLVLSLVVDPCSAVLPVCVHWVRACIHRRLIVVVVVAGKVERILSLLWLLTILVIACLRIVLQVLLVTTVIIVTLVTFTIIIVLVARCRSSKLTISLRWILSSVVVLSLIILIIIVVLLWLLLLLLLAVIVGGLHLLCWRQRVILVNDSETMQLTITALLRVKHCGRLMTLGINGGECLESIVGLLVEHVALEHVVGHNLVQRHVLLGHQLVDQFSQLRVLLLEARKLQLCRLLQLSELFEVCGRLARIHSLFFVVGESLVEVSQSFVSDLFTVIADSELVRPGADRVYRLIQLLDELLVHRGDLAVDIDDATRLIEVVVVLSKD